MNYFRPLGRYLLYWYPITKAFYFTPIHHFLVCLHTLIALAFSAWYDTIIHDVDHKSLLFRWLTYVWWSQGSDISVSVWTPLLWWMGHNIYLGYCVLAETHALRAQAGDGCGASLGLSLCLHECQICSLNGSGGAAGGMVGSILKSRSPSRKILVSYALAFVEFKQRCWKWQLSVLGKPCLILIIIQVLAFQ